MGKKRKNRRPCVGYITFDQHMARFLYPINEAMRLLPQQCLLIIGENVTTNLVGIVRIIENRQFELNRETICWFCGKEEVCKKVG